MPLEIIEQHTSAEVKHFKEIYEKNRFLARLYAIERKPSESFTFLNDCGNGKFQIFEKTKRYGVSSTLKLYASYKTNTKYIVGNGKFYRHERNNLMPIFTNSIPAQYQELFEKNYSWLRFYKENKLNLPMNTVVSRRLYDLRKAIRYMYGTDIETGIKIHKLIEPREWKTYRKNLINIENFNVELLKNVHNLVDAISMAYKLNLKVNAAWSVKRLEDEHNKMSINLAGFMSSFDNRKLFIGKPFIDFAEQLPEGFKLLETSGQLSAEGAIQQHCVGSYASTVDRGQCAIFRYKDYTMELRLNGKIHLGQLNGKRNSRAPVEEREYINGLVEKFNNEYKFPKAATLHNNEEIPF